MYGQSGGSLYEVSGSITGMTRFLHDGSDLVAEYDPSGAMLRRYVHGDAPGALRQAQGDRPLVWFEGSGVADGQRRYLYPDECGVPAYARPGLGSGFRPRRVTWFPADGKDPAAGSL